MSIMPPFIYTGTLLCGLEISSTGDIELAKTNWRKGALSAPDAVDGSSTGNTNDRSWH